MRTLYKEWAVGLVATVILVGSLLGMLVLIEVDLNQPNCNCFKSEKLITVFIKIKDEKGTCTCPSNSKIEKPGWVLKQPTPDI